MLTQEQKNEYQNIINTVLSESFTALVNSKKDDITQALNNPFHVISVYSKNGFVKFRNVNSDTNIFISFIDSPDDYKNNPNYVGANKLTKHHFALFMQDRNDDGSDVSKIYCMGEYNSEIAARTMMNAIVLQTSVLSENIYLSNPHAGLPFDIFSQCIIAAIYQNALEKDIEVPKGIIKKD